MADRAFFRTRLAPVLCLLAAVAGCPDDRVATTSLPGGVDVAALLPEHRALVRVSLAIDGGALAETDLELASDQTLSGTFDVQNVEAAVERTMTLRIYGRFSPTSEEVVLGRLEKPITLQPETDVAIAFGAGDVFDTCDGEAGACAVLFDANRNGLSNIEDLLERTRSAGRGIDPAPQAPYLVTSSEQLQFPSGVRLGTFSRQLVVLENFGSNPVTVTEASVVGGQGFSISILDPTGQSVAPPGRALAGDAFRTIAPGQEAFVAVSFTPVNSFVTTGALFVRVRDDVTLVEQTARVKLIANPEGELRPADPVYVEPDLDSVVVDGGSLPVVAFPNAQLQSGDALIAEDALGAGLRQSGASLTILDGAVSVPFPADAAFAVDVRSGERFSTAIDGLTSDVDIAVLEVDAAGAVVGLACPDCRSANAGTSPEAVEFKNDGAARRVVVVLGRIEPESDEPENEGALTVAETVSFRCSTTVSFGPEFAAIDPVLPTTGPLEGGIAVTLRGSGFDPRARVLVGQAEALDVSISRDDAGNDTVSFTLPAAVGVENPASIIVENPTDGGDGQAATLLESFSYQPPAPVVDEIRPDVAPTTGGTTPVTIIGRFFSARQGPPQVSFGTVTVDATFVSASELTVTPPAHIDPLTSATVSVKVRNRLVADDGTTVSLGSASNGVAFRYLVPAGAAPTLTAIDPATGSIDGNTRVTVTGTDFRPGAQVFFGARAATCDTPSSTTTMSCFTPPADAPASADIIVVNADGQSAKLDAGYAYEIPSPTISSVFPARGITDGGTLLVVEGGGFRPGARVTFVQGETTRAATAATRVSGTTMLVTTPAGTSGNARLVITNLDTQDVEADFTYFAPDAATPPPAITALTPAVGDSAGGFPVTVSGTGFLAPAVVFGSTNVQVVSFVDRDPPELDEVTVVAPPSPTGVAAAVTVQIINDDGQSATNGFNYTFSAAAPPRIDRVDPSSFVAGQTTPFTINGARFDAGARVIVGGLQASLQSVSSTTIRATLSGQLAPGTVMVVVENPNGGAVAAPVGVTAPVVVGAPIVTSVSTSDIHANVAGDVITIFGDNFDQGTLEVLTSADGQGATAIAPRILTRGKNVIVLELPALASVTPSTRHTLSLRFSGAGVTTLTVPLVARRPVIVISDGNNRDETARELVLFGDFLHPAALVGVDFVGITASLPCEVSVATERTIVCALTGELPAGTVLRPVLTWQGQFNGQAQAPVEVPGEEIGLVEFISGPPLQAGSGVVAGHTDFGLLPQTVTLSVPGLNPAEFDGQPPSVTIFAGGVDGSAIVNANQVVLTLTAGRVSPQNGLNYELRVGDRAVIVQGQLSVGNRSAVGNGSASRTEAWNTPVSVSGSFLLDGDEGQLVARRATSDFSVPLTTARTGNDLIVTNMGALAPGGWLVCFSDQLGFCAGEFGIGLNLFIQGVVREAFEVIDNGLAFNTFVSDTIEDGGTDRYFFVADAAGAVDVFFNNQCAGGMSATLTTRQGGLIGDLCGRATNFNLSPGEHVVAITNATGVSSEYSLFVAPAGAEGEGEGEGEGEIGTCGNGIVDIGEECDAGPNNGVSINAFNTVQVLCDGSCREPIEPELILGVSNIGRTITAFDDDVFPIGEVTARQDLRVFTTLRNGTLSQDLCANAITVIIEDESGFPLITSSNGTGDCAFASVTVDPGRYRARVRATLPGETFTYRIGAFVVGPTGTPASCVGGVGDAILQIGEACDDGPLGSLHCSPSCIERFEPDTADQPQLETFANITIERALAIGDAVDFIAFDAPGPSTFTMRMSARAGGSCGDAPLAGSLTGPGTSVQLQTDAELCLAGTINLGPGRHLLALGAGNQAFRYSLFMTLAPSGGGGEGEGEGEPPASCGNGVVEPGEQCDEFGQFVAQCDSNCLEAVEGQDGLNGLNLGQVQTTFQGRTLTPGDVDRFTYNVPATTGVRIVLNNREGPSCSGALNQAFLDGPLGFQPLTLDGRGCLSAVLPAQPEGQYRLEVQGGSQPMKYEVAVELAEGGGQGFCGDGVVSGPEQCDDLNQSPGDGCSGACQVEPGFICTGSPSECAPPVDGLVAHYKLIFDRTGGGPSITSDGSLTVDHFGASDAAIFYPGTPTSGGTAFVPLLPTGNAPRTLSAWVNTTSTVSSQIVGWGTSSLPSGRFALFMQGTGNVGFVGEGADFFPASPLINDGQWHHVAATYNGSFIELYVDGVPLGQQFLILSTNGQTLRVANAPEDHFPEPLAGAVDDIRVYNRVLAQAEFDGIITQPTVNCGNASEDFGELCDDGNVVNGDGCSACLVDAGATCVGAGPGSCILAGEPFQIRARRNRITDALGIGENVPGGQMEKHNPPQTFVVVAALDRNPTHFSLALAGTPNKVMCDNEFDGDTSVFLCTKSNITSEIGRAKASFRITGAFNGDPGGVTYRTGGQTDAPLRRLFDGPVSFEPGTSDDEIVWARVTTCGNGAVQDGEGCDDGNRIPGDGCDASCATEPGFGCTGAPSTCTELFCQSFDLTTQPGAPFVGAAGAFTGAGYQPVSRSNVLTTDNLQFPVSVEVEADWAGTIGTGGDIAFVGVRSSGLPVGGALEPEASIYLRLHIGVGVNQADLAVGPSPLVTPDSGTMPGGGSFTRYSVHIIDDGVNVTARITDPQTQATPVNLATSTPTQPSPGNNRIVLGGEDVVFRGATVCQGGAP